MRVHPQTGRRLVYVDCATDEPEAATVGSPDELIEVRWVDLDEIDCLMPNLFGPVGIVSGSSPISLLSCAVTYLPDEHDELVGEAMVVGGPAFVDDLRLTATAAAEASCPWDGDGEDPAEDRDAWLAAARFVVSGRRVNSVRAASVPTSSSQPSGLTWAGSHGPGEMSTAAVE